MIIVPLIGLAFARVGAVHSVRCVAFHTPSLGIAQMYTGAPRKIGARASRLYSLRCIATCRLYNAIFAWTA